MPQTIQAILFDLGDTLLDFGRVNLRGLFDLGGRLAHQYLRDEGLEVPSLAKYRRMHLRSIHWHVFLSAITRREFNARDLMAKLSRKMGLSLAPEQIDELCWMWYEPLHRCATVEEGLGEMLRDFQQQGIRLGIVSNTFLPGSSLDRHLAEHDLLQYFPVRVYSCDVGRRKPHPSIFRKAVEAIGVSPGGCMFVGDTPKPDIGGSNRMGMVSVLKDVQNKYARCRFEPDYRIGSILELAEVAERHRP